MSLFLLLFFQTYIPVGFLGGSGIKESASNAGDPGSIPGLGRSPREGNAYPLPSILACRIPWSEKPGRLQSMGLEIVWQAEHPQHLISNLLLWNIPLMKNSISLIGSMLFTFSTLSYHCAKVVFFKKYLHFT